jgi:hypothetical protein
MGIDRRKSPPWEQEHEGEVMTIKNEKKPRSLDELDMSEVVERIAQHAKTVTAKEYFDRFSAAISIMPSTGE